MTTKKKLTLKFYQNLGKLFYAIAAADRDVRAVEFNKLKELVKKHWLDVDIIEDDFKTDAAYQIEIVFNWLDEEEHLDAKGCYNTFVNYKNEQPHLFTEDIKKLILKTAYDIAASFSGLNKSELIMLAKLDLELKKNRIMNYYFSTITKGSFETIEAKVIELLKDEGFGVLTEIDIQQTLKNKLDVDFKKYKILGACNPPFAYKALQVENKIGTMLPCNVIIQESGANTIEVSAINPMVSMQAVKNDQLHEVGKLVSEKLENVIKNITNEK
ncbi:DUF302 domain-containing protein [Thalassobellus suaedae]